MFAVRVARLAPVLVRGMSCASLMCHLLMIVLAPASAEPIRLAEDVVGPPIWCDRTTLVYAGQPNPRTNWPTAIYSHVVPDGPPELIAKVDGITVPFHCQGGRILYWILPSADCAPLRRAVMVKQIGGEAAVLACGANLALPSPDGRLLAISAGPVPREPWQLSGSGVRVLRGAAAPELITVDLDGREAKEILMDPDVLAQLPTRDFVDARFGVHRMLASYARGRGAYQWVADDAIAVTLHHAADGGASVVVVRVDRDSGRIKDAGVISSAESQIAFVQPVARSQFFIAAGSDFSRSLRRCEARVDDVDCRQFDLAGVLAGAGLTNWESLLRLASFSEQGSSFRVIADSEEGRCLASVDLNSAKHRCLVRNLDTFSPLRSAFMDLILPSPDEKWLAYTVGTSGGWPKNFDIYLVPLR